MIQFSKLRLHGFKSFVEKTELDISPGLNGVVGPNGCGKSNLVEALRWCMGENSSKRMRGGTGSMEDVIFAGTEKRPQRNSAEVSLLLDNSKRTAPAAYNDSDEIEVTRKIEREHGSSYRINGKVVRARDVQLLFADLTSGAGSPFLVSQGKVTNMIQAKPHERRQLLEEAAGITGLYARRHEAELRLRATDNNLKRVEDLLAGMDSRLQALKKQARQATKYRNLSAQIRQLEVMVASLEWKRSHEKLQEIERVLGQAESEVAERLSVVTQLNLTQNTQSQDLPGLRQQDAEMAAALQAQNLALQRLEDEAQRIESQLNEAKAQLEQLYSDRSHEQQSLSENANVIERLNSEEKQILSTQDNEERDLQIREETRAAAQKEVDALEAAYAALMQEITANRTRKQSLEQQIAQNKQRRDSLQQRLGALESNLAGKQSALTGGEEADVLRNAASALEEKAESLRAQSVALEEKLQESRNIRDINRQALQEKEKEKSRLDAEISTLESIVKAYAEEDFRAVFEDIQTDQGFELALSRALGDTLMASLDETAPVVWGRSAVDIAALPALPAGVTTLAPHVRAPEPLRPALSQIGLVDSEDDGNRLSAQLKPGQALVSRDGAYWRWDGLRVRVTASDRHAVQLQQKNKLIDLSSRAPIAEASVVEARAAMQGAEEAFRSLESQLGENKSALQSTDSEARTKRAELNRLIESQSAARADIAKLEEALSLTRADLEAVVAALAQGENDVQTYSEQNFAELQQKIDAARNALNEGRGKLQDAISAFEVSRQENSRRKARLQAIADERDNLQARSKRANERLSDLEQRETQLKSRIEELQQRPAEIRVRSEELLSKISQQEAERAVVSDKLATCEGELAETARALKEAEGYLAQAREGRVRAQATAEERQSHIEGVRSFIQEQFGISPEELAAEAAISDEAMPDLDTLKQQKEKAVRDRDLIGPVNLRADQEAEELETELSGILKEKDDLMEAINELRQAIQTLNKEARDRLQEAFDKVNAHFGEMFGRLFIGGKAHLSLIDSDDPLEAGLEIFAQPPGKALQSLSLLSGGEQTLTAIALIFAIFMTNPSPICVLDEVDAPLDDANVDRFCDLLDEFAQRGETRFILITHHRLTMARMDRLYGVTMAERGVSQLVSVDLNQQLDFLEAA